MINALTFKQYLHEGHGSSRTIPISPKQAFENIAEHCAGVARQMKKQVIYRGGSGMGNDHAYHGNSNVGKPRRSANTANYFTLWHDNDREWADFPKRSRSFICASDYDVANAFGDVHILVPYDNAHVGVVPDEDLFGAIVSPDGEYLNEFNDVISAALSVVQKELDRDHADTWPELKKQLGLATRELLEEHDGDDAIKIALRWMEETTSLTLYGVVMEVFSPKGKGFKQGTAASIVLPTAPSELYVQGEGIFLPWSVRESEREKFEEGYIELLQHAIEKYGWDLDL